MKRVITFFTALLVCFVSTAQISDHLYKLLPEEYKPKDREHISDKEKRLILYGADEYASHTDTAAIGELNQMAVYLEHAGNKDSIFDRAKNLSAVGEYHRSFLDKGKDAAVWVPYYQHIIEMIREDKRITKKEQVLLSNAYIATGNYFEQASHYEEAAENYTYALNQSKEINDTSSVGAAYICLSNMYNQLGLYKESIEYLDTSLLYSTASEKKEGLALVYQMDSYNDKTWRYLGWYKQSGSRAYLDSAWVSLSKMSSGDKSWAPVYYYAKSRYYFVSGVYDRALSCIDSSLAMPDENVELHAGKLLLKGLCLLNLGKEEGRNILLQNLEVAGKDLKTAITVYDVLYRNAKQHGNAADALHYYEQARIYEDSVSLMSQRGKVFEVMQKYNIVQKESEIKTLEGKNILREKERNQAIYGVVIAVLVLLISVLFFRNRIRRQQLEKLKILQELQQEQQARKEIDFLSNLETKAIIQETVIAERKEISEDLHDELGSSLASLKFYIADLRRRAVMEESKDLLSQLEVEANFVYEHTRSYMHSLNRQSVELQKSYNFFLEDLLRQFPLQSSLNFELDIDYAQARERLQPQEYNQVVQIIRESIINILKHAHATEVKVSVQFSDEECRVAVKDNGVGFSNDIKAGLGLKSIQNRAGQLNGTCRFDSGAGGTTVHVVFPLTIFEIV